MEVLGQIKYLEGIRKVQHENHIDFIQDKFIKKLIDKFKLSNSRSTKSPIPGNLKYFKHLPGKTIPHPFNYCREIGLLQYLVQGTRPYLTFATSFLSQFLEDPKGIHFNTVKHILA
ncbi:hypothetical protein O181_010654 [Austropuccinia psidii MF-1]|uniref:Reverse transcriptase Ty1/copia-type domain-containing protein n=1 Tax=Austropuccinia psidii MF-1 TaxID=1389203 RepID=A0A9Q3BRG9_9BASI|nr:hypothetical protein [Austropuccinia psidii MF-1]